MISMTTASIQSPRKAETSEAAISSSVRMLVNCSNRIDQGLRPLRSTNSLGPYCARRAVASAAVNPPSVVPSKCNASAAVVWNQMGAPSPPGTRAAGACVEDAVFVADSAIRYSWLFVF